MIKFIFVFSLFVFDAQAADLNCKKTLGIGGIVLEETKVLFNSELKTLSQFLLAKDPATPDLEFPLITQDTISSLKIQKSAAECSLTEVETDLEYQMKFICIDYDVYSKINIELFYSKEHGYGNYFELRFKKSLSGPTHKDIQVPFANCK